MKLIKQDTWLPVFTGYYNSIFGGSDHFVEYETELDESEYQEHYSELFKAGVSYGFFKENFWNYCDFDEAFNTASEYICDGLLQLDHTGIIQDIKYQKTVSPKYYNFSTDSINCEIEYDAEKLKEYIKNNMEKYTEYIKRKYTSRDGFSSSYSNDINDWLDFEDLGDHGLGSVLEFVFLNENVDQVDLCYELNLSEVFLNETKIDFKKMIADFKKQAA